MFEKEKEAFEELNRRLRQKELIFESLVDSHQVTH